MVTQSAPWMLAPARDAAHRKTHTGTAMSSLDTSHRTLNTAFAALMDIYLGVVLDHRGVGLQLADLG